MKRFLPIATCAVAAVVLSACGASRPTTAPVAAHYGGTGSLAFVASGPSTELGVDNRDIYSATPGGRVRNLTSSGAAEAEAAWSADGSQVVFVRETSSGHDNGGIAFKAGVYVWSPGHRAPSRIASCSDVCSQSFFAWSPDDRRIAFVSGDAWGPGDHAIEVMNADGSGAHAICDHARCGYGLAKPMWSPDSRKLVFSNEGSVGSELFGGSPPSPIWVANADGSGLEKLTQPNCDPSNNRTRGCAVDTGPAWSPNGRQIAFSRSRRVPSTGREPCGRRRCPPALPRITTSVEVMRADGSHSRTLYRCGGESTCNETLPLAWAPDGKSIAFGPTTARDSSVHLTTLGGKTTAIRTCAGSRCVQPETVVWSPNGTQLAFIAGGSPQASGVWVIGRNGKAMHRVAAGGQCCLAWMRKVVRSGAKALPQLTPGRHFHLAGSIVYGTALNALRPFNLLSSGATGTRVAGVPSIKGKEPALSPDGREIAFTGVNRGNYFWNIRVADRDGKNVRALTDFGAETPAWSPDGRTIAFTKDPGGPHHWIAVVSAAGGHIRILTTGMSPSWSPSGAELVFQRRVAAGEALFTVRSDGHRLRHLTKLPGGQYSPAWSPDGKEIAFEWTTPAGFSGLYLIRPDGTHLRRVTSAALPPGRPTWSPDSRYLAVVSAGEEPSATSSRVLVIDVKTGRVATVATAPGQAADPSWSSR